ncbi:MAG: DUF4097 family beta strand repeat protein [Sedimentisphaerales bacterium]|nr:DUF4097 family beta strand repeat protein [Sedimentisphaerales bacterium]
MRQGIHQRVSLAFLLGLLLFLASSCIYIDGCGYGTGWGASARHERQVELSAPLPAGSAFQARTRDGSITVEGAATSECTVLATIRAYAKTQEKAQELAEEIQVKLEASDAGLAVVIDKPTLIQNASFGVSLVVTLPVQTSLDLVTSDGSVRITNIQGAIVATTSDGSVRVEHVQGNARLKTSDGSIHLAQMRGDSLEARTSDGSIRGESLAATHLVCHTSDGSIHVECAPDAPNAPEIALTTSDGGITFAAPPDLSAVIDASTSDGSIHTSLPITVHGRVGKSLNGTIGAGEGRVTLRTSDGSITIR